MNQKPMQTVFTSRNILGAVSKSFSLEIESFWAFWWWHVSGGKIVESVDFFSCFTLCFFQFLKRLHAFRRQWSCSLIPISPVYWWSPSTLSKRAPSILLLKRHQHSRLILGAPSKSNETALTPKCRARSVRKNSNVTLSVDHNLNNFQSTLTLLPMWR